MGTQTRSETYQGAKEIHGAYLNDTSGHIGLIGTAERTCPTKILFDFMSKSKKFSQKVFPELYENAAKTFETLDINMLRGVCVIFSKGLCVRKSTDLSTDLFQ